jgi:hypothetical protein
MGAAEVRARIQCLRGRFDAAADHLAAEPPSALKAHVLSRSGRLGEAAACLLEMSPSSSDPRMAARAVYLDLASAEILGEGLCLEAETLLRFSTVPEGATP